MLHFLERETDAGQILGLAAHWAQAHNKFFKSCKSFIFIISWILGIIERLFRKFLLFDLVLILIRVVFKNKLEYESI